MTPDEIQKVLEQAGYAERSRLQWIEMGHIDLAKQKLGMVIVIIILASIALIPLTIGLMIEISERWKG